MNNLLYSVEVIGIGSSSQEPSHEHVLWPFDPVLAHVDSENSGLTSADKHKLLNIRKCFLERLFLVIGWALTEANEAQWGKVNSCESYEAPPTTTQAKGVDCKISQIEITELHLHRHIVLF